MGLRSRPADATPGTVSAPGSGPIRLVGRPVIAGEAEGPLLHSGEPLSFWGGYDAETGRIIDRRHPLAGENGAGSVLALPATRGSSTTAAVLLEAIRRGTAPAALITLGVDSFLSLASFVGEEMHDRVPPLVAVEEDAFRALAAWPRLAVRGRELLRRE